MSKKFLQVTTLSLLGLGLMMENGFAESCQQRWQGCMDSCQPLNTYPNCKYGCDQAWSCD